MIPLSTCLSDPKYYSNGGKPYQDKRGVWNGFKANIFIPNETCEGLCRGPQNCTNIGTKCKFLNAYKKQLSKLDFNHTMELLEKFGSRFDFEPTYVLIVYEKPDNPCSERWPLVEWFKENGVDLEEFK